MGDLISEEWLQAIGFRWHQLDRQSDKHWLLWIGGAQYSRTTTYEDLGIEVAPTLTDHEWFCWLRSDAAGRYHRFIHLRHIRSPEELESLISALIGYKFNPDNAIGGTLHSPEQRARMQAEIDRMDQRMLRENSKHHPWYPKEKDEAIGGPLHEHQQAYLDARKK